MKIRRRILIPLCCLSLAGSIIVLTEIYKRSDYQSKFIDRKGRLVLITERPIEGDDGYAWFDFHLENDKNLQVDGTIKIPASGREPYPVLLMLGGLRTGKQVIDYIRDTRDVILIALDYPYTGEKGAQTVWEFLPKVPAMREAVLNTVPAAMLTIDYLRQRPDTDSGRLVLVGGSIGALFAPALAAADPRIEAVAILFGAGDLQNLIYVNTELPRPAAALAAWLGAPLVSPVEPLKYIDRISPRPVLMINGTGDPRMPLEGCLALHEKAKPPKKIHWVDSGHLHVRSREFHRLLRMELVTWLDENDLIEKRCFLTDSAGIKSN